MANPSLTIGDLFLLDACGAFRPGEVVVHWCGESAPSSPDINALIAESWSSWQEACRRRGAVLFNGPLVRHIRHRVEGNTLLIDAGPTDYAAFIGTNYLNAHRGPELGWECFSNPLGTSATVITSDGWLLLGRRNDRVACHPGHVHTFGGGLEAGEKRPDGTFDVFASILRELQEELGLQTGETADLVCLGLIRDAEICQPELIFDAIIAPTRAELESRWHHGDPDDEHDALIALRDDAEAITTFFRDHQPIAPIAFGALCLHGRYRFGDGWFRRLIGSPAPDHAQRSA